MLNLVVSSSFVVLLILRCTMLVHSSVTDIIMNWKHVKKFAVINTNDEWSDVLTLLGNWCPRAKDMLLVINMIIIINGLTSRVTMHEWLRRLLQYHPPPLETTAILGLFVADVLQPNAIPDTLHCTFCWFKLIVQLVYYMVYINFLFFKYFF